MKRITKRQQKRIDYFLRDKHSRKEKQNLLHNEQLPKYLEKRIPIIRRLSRNIDQILIVSSFVSPPIKPGMIDRLLVVAEIEKIKPIICLNKCDLEDDEKAINHFIEIYETIGYEVFATSAKSNVNIDRLGKLILGKTSALAGHSGVGKSSLLNAINPNLEIEVGEVSSWSNKGVHTTTKVTTFKLDDKTELIDLPGIKKLDFIDIHRDEARFNFTEFEHFAEECKFNNCLHLSEVNCAVKWAVEKGKIAKERYKSYCNFVESL
jgi:ribosome biogenesis GTPase